MDKLIVLQMPSLLKSRMNARKLAKITKQREGSYDPVKAVEYTVGRPDLVTVLTSVVGFMACRYEVARYQVVPGWFGRDVWKRLEYAVSDDEQEAWQVFDEFNTPCRKMSVPATR